MSRMTTRDETGRIHDQPELLTVEEFRRAARIGRSAAYELVRAGELPHVRYGRLTRIPRSVLLPSTTQPKDEG